MEGARGRLDDIAERKENSGTIGNLVFLDRDVLQSILSCFGTASYNIIKRLEPGIAVKWAFHIVWADNNPVHNVEKSILVETRPGIGARWDFVCVLLRGREQECENSSQIRWSGTDPKMKDSFWFNKINRRRNKSEKNPISIHLINCLESFDKVSERVTSLSAVTLTSVTVKNGNYNIFL